jgi:hypothetical protein
MGPGLNVPIKAGRGVRQDTTNGATTMKQTAYAANDLMDNPLVANFLLLHELSTIQHVRDALLGTFPIKLGDTDTHAIADRLTILVEAMT